MRQSIQENEFDRKGIFPTGDYGMADAETIN